MSFISHLFIQVRLFRYIFFKGFYDFQLNYKYRDALYKLTMVSQIISMEPKILFTQKNLRGQYLGLADTITVNPSYPFNLNFDMTHYYTDYHNKQANPTLTHTQLFSMQ